MPAQKNQAYYRHRPIGSLEALSRVLDYPVAKLIALAEHADKKYRLARQVEKVDGSIRNTFDAREPLKAIQGRIQKRILGHVNFPEYLQGGIKDRDRPRHYKADASLHTHKKTLISEDITNYFPSTSRIHIKRIWLSFFNFPPDVAEILTRLTTKEGGLVQGARTSTALSNLVFWDSEPALVARIESQGLTYSRFIDDITVSTDRRLTDTEKSAIISEVFLMLNRKGVRPNRRKHKIFKSGQRMSVHRVNVNSRKPTLPQERRASIRAAVRHCELQADLDRAGPDYERLFSRTSGLVGTLAQFHPKEATRLRSRLKDVKPITKDAGSPRKSSTETT